MTIKDLIDQVKTTIFNSSDGILTDTTQDTYIDSVVRSTLEDVALKYIVSKATFPIELTDGKFDLTSLNTPIKRVLSLRKNGTRYPTTIEGDILTAKIEGSADLTVLTYPEIPSSKTAPLPFPRVLTPKVLESAVLARYYFGKGLTTEGTYYQSIFASVVQDLFPTTPTPAGIIKGKQFI